MVARTFLRGLAAILPIALTIYVIYWLAAAAESVLGGAIRAVVPESIYIPGMGVIAGVVVVFLLGILMKIWLARAIFRSLQRLLERIPLVKSIYGSLRDVMEFASADREKKLGQTVMVDLGDGFGRVMGFVTRTDFDELPEGIAKEEEVAVYLPMSYQLGGYTLMVPRSSTTPVDLATEDALRFALTAGVPRRKDPAPEEE